MKFYQDYGVFIKEGVVTNEDPTERVCILLFICFIFNIYWVKLHT